MKWPLNLPEPQMLVYYFAKSIGLAPFTVEEDGFHPPTLLNKLHTLFLATSYFVVFQMAAIPMTRFYLGLNLSKIEKAGSIMEYFSSLAGTFATPIIFLSMYKNVLHVMNKLYLISDDLESSGTEENRKTFFKNLLVVTCSANIVLIAVCVILMVIEPKCSIVIPVKFSIDYWVHLNVTLIFAQVLLFIKQRFALVNEKIGNLLSPGRHLRRRRRSQIFPVSENYRAKNRAEDLTEDLTDRQRIRKIELLHLDLSELVNHTTRLFAVPIFLNTLRLCTQLILGCFYIYLISQKKVGFCRVSEIGPCVMSVLSTVIRMVIAIVELFAFAHASVEIREEAKATKTVLFKVWNDFKPRELEREFSMFTLQMEHKPVRVAVFGGLDLDYSYPYKILGAVMTYVIIAVQFEMV